MQTSSNPWKSISLVLAGILIGCGAGAVNSAVANYPPNPAAPKWQHHCIEVMDPSSVGVNKINPIIARQGDEAWELVGVSYSHPSTGAVMCFTRPAPVSATAAPASASP